MRVGWDDEEQSTAGALLTANTGGFQELVFLQQSPSLRRARLVAALSLIGV